MTYDHESKCPNCGVWVGWVAKVNQDLVWCCNECEYQLTPIIMMRMGGKMTEIDETRFMYIEVFSAIAEATRKVVERNVQLQMEQPTSSEIKYSGRASTKLYEAQRHIAGALAHLVGLDEDEIDKTLKLDG